MTDCTSCGNELELPLVCGSCDELQEPTHEPAPHEVFGLAPSMEVDGKSLAKRLMRLSRSMHPDFFGCASSATRELAERNTARVNAAFKLLSDRVALADWWITKLGGPTEADERQMPQAFLMEVLEWNETIDDADGADDRDIQLAPLAATLNDERETTLQAVTRAFSDLPQAPTDLVAVRRQLNAVRYLDRALARISTATTIH